jgi:putative oxidoreductase
MKHNKDLGLFLLRLALALVFIAHGWAKLTGLGMTESFFSSIGIPAAGAMAVIVALVELLGGLSMLTGLFTNYSGWFLFVVMGVAILQVKLAKGFMGGRKGREHQEN